MAQVDPGPYRKGYSEEQNGERCMHSLTQHAKLASLMQRLVDEPDGPCGEAGPTDGEPGWETDPEGLLMGLDQLLPQDEQRPASFATRV